MTRNSGERYKRLSSALRDNLLKRKEQQRSRQLDRHEKNDFMSHNLLENKIKENGSQKAFSEDS